MAVWEIRDLGIDMKHCAKLVEAGIPSSTPTPVSQHAIHETIGSNLSAGRGDPVYSGYAKNWYEDGVGKTLTYDETDLTWGWDGTCATGGSTSGVWQWFGNSGWVLDNNGGSNTTTCLRQIGETYSAFHNGAFCSPITTYITYSYVDFYGYYDGTWDAARSNYYSGACLPIYEHWVFGGPA